MGFTQERLIEYNAGLLAICMVALLGFVDDVIDLKWRHKMIVPTVASLPLLVAYKGLTSVVVPKMLRAILGNYINLGIFYFIYIFFTVIFYLLILFILFCNFYIIIIYIFTIC